MFNLKRKKRAFTLAETLIVASLFAVMVLGIIFGINRAFAFMNNTRVLVRATNFAREGVEMVYNLRDTNRRRCSGIRDATRLYRGGTDTACSDIGTNTANLLTEGIYTIKERKTLSGDSFIYAEYLTGVVDFYEDIEIFFNSSNKDKAKLTFSGTYLYYSGGKIATGNMEDLLGGTGIEFYRLLRVHGVYKKDVTEESTNVTEYTNSDPKEMRFCVKIIYTYNGSHHSSELCSIMTNFME